MATREPLGDFLTALVAILAILIILVNGLLCVFLVRDSRLWKLVRPDYMIESITFSVQRVNRLVFSLAFADLLVGIVLIPQVVHEDWIQKAGVAEFDKTTCRHLNSQNSIVLFQTCIL